MSTPTGQSGEEAITPRPRGRCSFLSDPWSQIIIVSFISFCNPGMYNALTGMGGSGQVDGTVAANSNVATHACTAGAALLLVGTLYRHLGPRASLALGGWTYAMYAGALLHYTRTGNGAFVVAAGALLGVGAAFFWVAQGTVMVTYTTDRTRGRAIGLFWVIFNLGGAVGSLASFGLNFRSESATVTDSTYLTYIVVMLFGWALSGLVVSAEQLSDKYTGTRMMMREAKQQVTWANMRDTLAETTRVVLSWRNLCLYPMFFTANVFYSYQQNNVNGSTFTLRTRSLNGALYWMAQMLGGLLMGIVLDSGYLQKPGRARAGWLLLLVSGMAIWGGGYRFQLWNDLRMRLGHKQDVDYTDGGVFLGPMFLYILYGAYDSFWQAFCYWIIGAQSRSAVVNAVVVGAYSALKPAGGAMAWRINAQGYSAMTQLAMNWGLTVASLMVAVPTILVTGKEPPPSEADSSVVEEVVEEKL